MKTRQMMTAGILMLVMVAGVASCKSEWRAVSALADGPKVTETRALDGFEQIEISGSPRVYYTQADSFSVVVEGPQAGIDDILTEVKDGTLLVRNRGKVSVVNISFGDEDAVAVYVTSPDLTAVRLNGSGDFVSQRRVDTDKMDVVLRGSGDIDMKDLISDRCDVQLVGSGNVDIDRLESRSVSASLVGSGDIDLQLEHVDAARLALKGSGDIKAGFGEGCGSVDCDLRGSGDITLKGQVAGFSSHKSGSGDVDADELKVGSSR